MLATVSPLSGAFVCCDASNITQAPMSQLCSGGSDVSIDLLLLTQFMLSGKGRKLDHIEVLPFKASANAVEFGNVGAPGCRLFQCSHHLGKGVVSKLNGCRGLTEGIFRKFDLPCQEAKRLVELSQFPD